MFDFEEEIDGGDIPLKLPENYRIAQYMAQIQAEQHISAEEARKHIQAQFVETLKSGTDKASTMAVGDILAMRNPQQHASVGKLPRHIASRLHAFEYPDASDIHQPTITEDTPDVIYAVSFPHDGKWFVCEESKKLAKQHNVPTTFSDWEHSQLVSDGFADGYTIECIHTHFNKKVGYGSYQDVPLPIEIAERLFGRNGGYEEDGI